MEFVEKNKYYVYSISDPINKTPFYIGKGCGKRAWSHLKCKELNKNKNSIIATLQSIGLQPKIDLIVENLNEEDAYEIETIIIKNAVNYGIKLTNKVGIRRPPSRKGIKVSDETKLKISLKLRGIKRNTLTPEHRQKISFSNKGKEGPNKKMIGDVDLLKKLYVYENKTKHEICVFFNIGMGSLNRILHEHKIFKTKDNFIQYGKKLPQKTLIL